MDAAAVVTLDFTETLPDTFTVALTGSERCDLSGARRRLMEAFVNTSGTESAMTSGRSSASPATLGLPTRTSAAWEPPAASQVRVVSTPLLWYPRPFHAPTSLSAEKVPARTARLPEPSGRSPHHEPAASCESLKMRVPDSGLPTVADGAVMRTSACPPSRLGAALTGEASVRNNAADAAPEHNTSRSGRRTMIRAATGVAPRHARH